jgi:predicted XRE-type DNA-binding protein
MERKKIKLTRQEREEIKSFGSKGVHSAKLINRAKIILLLDGADGRKEKSQKEIAELLGVNRQTVTTVKRDFLNAQSVTKFLQRKERETPPVPAKITGEVEAHIIALACSPAPSGYARWTLSLLAEKSVELRYIDSISRTSINGLLRKRNLNLI